MATSSSSASSSSTPRKPLSQKFPKQLRMLCDAVSPSVVAILSYFAGPESREIPHSGRRGTGFFVEKKLIVTSAHLVGRVSTVTTVRDSDGEGESTIHNCFLARTIALTSKQQVLRTKPVAVNFANDLAVLEVVISGKERKTLPRPCTVAKATANDNRPLLGIVRHENCSVNLSTMPGIRLRHDDSARPKAPWPMDGELEWIRYGADEKTDGVIASVADIYGSPWFNFRKEVVGVASWAADVGDGQINSYAVPPSRIMSIVSYAKTKGSDDPIVMDQWINNVHPVPDNISEINEECVPPWTNDVVFQMFT